MQHNEEEGRVCISIGKKLNGLCSSPSECFIFKVHDQLRKVNERAFEPDIIAIGPYHFGKNKLQMMEEHKLRYLQFRLEENKENLQRFAVAMTELEGKVRRCYKEPLSLNEDELIEMMLLDGFFIVELMRKFRKAKVREENDPIFDVGWIVNSLQRDLLLFENQLPFFVLCKLFDMIEVPNSGKGFIALALEFFEDLFPGQEYRKNGNANSEQNIKHLLGLVHNNWSPAKGKDNPPPDWRFIPCVTKLREAGIKFRKGVKKIPGRDNAPTSSDTLFDIKFQKGVMHIPSLTIEDRTESFFRNLIAYEEYHHGIDDRHFIVDYVKLMDCLIDSSKDVEILCHKKIINNWLGDDETVSAMFNKLNDCVTGPGPIFHYAGIFNGVNEYYDQRLHRWMAKLRRDYFSSPWAIISVLAAFVLLVLTVLQTVYTIMG